MTAIERSSQLLSFLRSRVAEVQNADAAVRNKAVATPSQPAPQVGGTSQPLLQALEMLHPRIQLQLLQELRKLDQQDAQLSAKVFRLFMSAVLKQQFPALVKQDSELSQLVDQVITKMRSDSELCLAMEDAAAHLIKSATAAG